MRVLFKLLLILMLISYGFHANAQVLQDTATIKAIINHGKQILNHKRATKIQLDSALILYDQANGISRKINSQKWQNEASLFKAEWYLSKGDTLSAKTSYKQVTDDYQHKGQFREEAQTWKRLGEVMFYNVSGDPVAAMAAYEHARSIYAQHDLKLETANSIRDMGYVMVYSHRNWGNNYLTNEIKTVIATYTDLKDNRLPQFLTLMANYYWDMGDAVNSINYWIEVKKSADIFGFGLFKSLANMRIAISYYSLHIYPEALKYYQLVLAEYETQKDYEQYYAAVYGSVNIMIYLKPAHEILDFVNKSLSKVPRPADEYQQRMMSLAYGQTYTELKRYDEAEKYYVKMIQGYEERYKNTPLDTRVYGYRVCYISIGEFYIKSGQFEKARFYIDKLLQLPRSYSSAVFISNLHQDMFRIDSAAGQLISAIGHFQKSRKINDSIYTATNATQLSALTIKYKTEQQLQSIKLLNSEKKAQRAELESMALQRTTTKYKTEQELQAEKYKNEQQLLSANYNSGRQQQSIKLLNSEKKIQLVELERVNQQRNVVFWGALMFLIIAGLAYNGYRLKQKSNRLLQVQQKEIDAKNTRLETLVSEKDWLLKEVHHRVKNNLHSVICLLESQAVYLENDALKAIEESQHRIYTMSLIHQKLYQSDDVTTIDMATYIPELIQYLSDSFNVSGQIHFSMFIEPIFLNPAQAIPLALIMNEALTNTIKYAFPGKRRGEITIALTASEQQFKLEVADNGVGMLDDSQKIEGSLGIELMKGLTKELGGDIVFENKDGVKVTVVFEQDSLNEMDKLPVDYLTADHSAEINL